MDSYKIKCSLCSFGSKIFGHRLTKILGKQWPKIQIEKVKPSLEGLDLEIVGGLAGRGYTEHDIDVVGNYSDVAIFVKRLKKIILPTLFIIAA